MSEIAEFRIAKRTFERAYVTAVLEATKGNITKAAKLAGKDRKDFYKLIERAGVNPKAFRC